MITLRKIMMTQMAFISIAFAGNGPLDDGVDVCGVPVCDVNATITALSELNENKRYNYTNKLVTKYKESDSIEILNNLVAAAKEIKVLTKAEGDADWVIREASNLMNNSIFNLAKFSEIKADSLTALFDQLDSQTKRFEVISYWQGQMDEIEKIKDLSELVDFAMNAADISKAKGDEAWVSRAAKALASDLTIKLIDLDPAHEGVYKVNMNKTDDLAVAFDKVIILDSSSEKNLVVRFINSKFNKVAFEYSHAKLVGTTIKAKKVSDGMLSSEMMIKIDRKTGTISGEIQTTMANKITFKGGQEFSTRQVFGGDVPYALTENSVIGEMTGDILGIKGKLSIRSFSPGTYAAHFVADNGFIVLDFVGKFFKKNGVLSLTHKNRVKLVVALRNVGDKVMWTGKSFSTTNGKVVSARFNAN